VAADVSREIAEESWVFEGNHISTGVEAGSRCELVVYLDLPPVLCAWRAFARYATYAGGGRADLPEGCDESFDFSFYWEILGWRREHDAHCQRVLEAAHAGGAAVRTISTAEGLRRICGAPDRWIRTVALRQANSRAQDGFDVAELSRVRPAI
jgi:adenylate kinase family enzyme